ncbi:Stk1 family PASTA domain-containing Ser/Thr kinase [Nocardioides sp. SYSU D00038]|uniref:Stk1 family PASTA domain-containing Ser/Thr kinase n=1 Tax=Nocardioides sp. SYSU D00038 TaxID=2812554 RepID=UPI001968461B|nr:Stk1 family PASTA domain-containing Ser/Thr kinase [Nocardioides sp. SYSU D00038]
MNDAAPSLVGGRYELGELLGRGGMAEVRKGIDTRLGRVVAIKRLRTDLASDATFQARFRREAQSSASLNHPSIVAVYDTGEEITDDGVAQPYIVMEYVAGRTLRDILREGRKILPERALEITSGVLSALDYSHRAGIIHRDIKPGNVMLTPSGDVKVMDFGIARAISDAASTMTQTAAVVGTAQYLSPEQARGETVDSRSDVYSAGCLLYELLTGRPPFIGDSPVAVAYQHVREPASPPSDHDTDLPEDVDAIVLKSLAKRVEDRYQSAAAMRSDVERYLAGRPVQAPPVPVPDPTPTPPPTDATMVRQPLPPPEDDGRRGPRTGLLLLLGLLVVALVVGGAFVLPQLFESAPEQEQVPNLIGLTEEQARQAIAEAGLTVGDVDYEPSEDVGKDEVIEQDPDRDLYVDPGEPVDLTVSSGLPMTSVPFVVGGSRVDARNQIRNERLRVKAVEEESDKPKDEVLRVEPEEGTAVPQNSVVTIYYSDGPEEVPDVVGLKQGEAKQRLRDANFVPEVVQDPTSTEPKGTVVRQEPRGTTAPENSTVIIYVSVYEPPPPPPTDTPPPPTDTPPLPTDGVPGLRHGDGVADATTGPRGSASRTPGRAGRRTPAR